MSVNGHFEVTMAVVKCNQSRNRGYGDPASASDPVVEGSCIHEQVTVQDLRATKFTERHEACNSINSAA
jgi:hypothetical protein